ncbi:MAG: hypothetical protein BWX73_00779 [Lentisphaerae bacterium ADurb.Bin082]|nr:MAG: hypothetical protein BWX73_00779 [Lentisphaerae bacterium ADurb.Bin082]
MNEVLELKVRFDKVVGFVRRPVVPLRGTSFGACLPQAKAWG